MGGLAVDFDEFRNFLEVCNHRGILFQSVLDFPSFGTITRIPNGWPPFPPQSRPLPAYGRVHGNIMANAVRIARIVIDKGVCFDNGFSDHDWEDFREQINFVWQRERPDCDDGHGYKISLGLGRRLFEAVVWELERIGGTVT